MLVATIDKMLIKCKSRFLQKLLITAGFALTILTFFLISEVYRRTHENSKIKPNNDFNSMYFFDEISLSLRNSAVDFNGEVIVHFDLKGAPPKVSHLKTIFRFIKQLGATGVLLEYEDMFPYQDDLEIIRALNSYNLSEISEILKTAESYNLTVIPLIQTFGHFEFVLKLNRFKYLREVEDVPEVLCPSHPESMEIIWKMIDQVMKAHPSVKYFHIGCDEVFTLGSCGSCQNMMKKYKLRKKDVYFAHIRKVALYITTWYPGVRPIIWGDEVIKETEHVIKNHNIPDVVDVMLWNYKSEQSSFPSNADMDMYAKLFKGIWVASAFKGATGMDQIVTNPEYHLNNNYGWMKTIENWKHKINFKGIVLTGWQRYNHFAVLCELLPVAVPSLAINLQFWKRTQEVISNDLVKRVLECNDYVPTTLREIENWNMNSLLHCQFPGFGAYRAIIEQFTYLRQIEKDLEVFKWPAFSFYNLALHYSHPRDVKALNRRVKFDAHLSYIDTLEKRLRETLAEVYDNHTIEEWILTHLMPHRFRVQAAFHIIKNMSKHDDWSRRPLDSERLHWNKFFNQVCNSVETKGCELIYVNPFHQFRY